MSVPPRSRTSIAGINNGNTECSTDNNATDSLSFETAATTSTVTGEENSCTNSPAPTVNTLNKSEHKETEEVEELASATVAANATGETGCTNKERDLCLSIGAAVCVSGTLSPEPMGAHHFDHHQFYPRGSHCQTQSDCQQSGIEQEMSNTPNPAREDPEPGRSPPGYLRWARHLHALLQDPDGVALFRRYLDSEGRSHVDALEFWFACEGLRKQSDLEHITRLVKAIYRRYFLKAQVGIGEELRKTVNKRIKEAGATGANLDAAVFDRSQKEVERLITETTYPNFLQSDLYLQHIQSVQNGSSSSSSGSASGSSSGSSNAGSYCPPVPVPPAIAPATDVVNVVTTVGTGCLATLHEDCELGSVDDSSGYTPQLTALPLTRDMLLATQKRRATELRPKPEAFAGLYLQNHGKSSHSTSTWIHHSSYNPVSRQDSELQSLSSDARTESDNMSMTDSSIDGCGGNGFSHRYSKKQYQLHSRQMKESANLNRDPYMHHMVIPRTQRLPKDQVNPLKPDEFAAILIEKLESVRRDQETKESLDRKLLEGSDICGSSMDYVGPTSLADAIREKLQVDVDDNDQDILDQHVSRVWADSLTPGLASPPSELRRNSRPSNPTANKTMMSNPSGAHVNTHPYHHVSMSTSHHVYQTHQRQHQRHSHSHSHSHSRKERDVFSTFSSDSGNVHDFPEGSEHRLHMTKSKSMPEYSDNSTHSAGNDGSGRFRQSGAGSSGRDRDRERERDWSGSGSGRRWSSKKTELTDSGVSVVSDTPPVSVSHTNKDSRVLSWLFESDKRQICGGQPTCGSHSAHSGERDSNSSCSLTKSYSHRVRPNALQSHSGVHSMGRASRNIVHSHSRSGSLERTGSVPSTGSGHAPAQPFVADPSMPPLPSPHTPTQLEEARRRLLEDDLRLKQPRQRYGSSSGSSSKIINMVQSSIALMDNAPVNVPVAQQSSGSALRKGVPGSGGNASTSGKGVVAAGGMTQAHIQPHAQPVTVPSETCTTVVFSFCDEQFPYRTKIPGQQVTLRQFKEYLPKKGLYRYFFKTECDEVDTKVIQEEIIDDNEILPLWEGKVMAQVKPIE